MAVGMLGAGLAVAPAASAAAGTTLRVAITSHGLYVDGPTTFPAGRVNIFLDASGADAGVELMRLHRGYSFKDYRGDFKIVAANLFGPGDTKTGLAALHRLINHTTALGGLYAKAGTVRHGTVLLPSAGNRYVLFDDTSAPKSAVHLTATAPAGVQTLQSTSATVVAREDRRWGGSTTLPAHGNITFANHADYSPHFVSLQHVKDGTTRQQVIDSFSSQTPPSFMLPGGQDSDIVSPGHAMVLHLQVPPGRYALMCFFPDPKTGMPHAFMGMVRMVTLT
jgi:hypothetical protein